MRVRWRRLAVVTAAAVPILAALAAVAFRPSSAAAQDGCKDACWIDVKTGRSVVTMPAGDAQLSLDRQTAFNPRTGQNFARESDGSWIDVKTGKCVVTLPAGGVQLSLDRQTAFNPRTGQNFARVPCPGQAAAAPTLPPQVGMVVEPKIGGGVGGTSSDPSYDSTGGQEPFKGDSSDTNGQLCGGATFYPGFAVGPARVGLDVNVCSGSNAFGNGDTTLFKIPRHGPGGDVDLRASSDVIIDVLFKGEVALGPANNWFLSGGVGPTFRDLDLKLTSDQSFFGGGVPSESNSNWQTGVVLSAGISTFVCPQCIGGYPLKLGVEGRARFFDSESVHLTSPVFGFTETGDTGDTTDWSVLTTVSTPLTISDMRVKRDVVLLARLDNGVGLYRYRYIWSDQLYVGVMAQEVARVKPEAVVRGADGYLRVDYRRLGMSLQTWEQWLNHKPG